MAIDESLPFSTGRRAIAKRTRAHHRISTPMILEQSRAVLKAAPSTASHKDAHVAVVTAGCNSGDLQRFANALHEWHCIHVSTQTDPDSDTQLAPDEINRARLTLPVSTISHPNLQASQMKLAVSTSYRVSNVDEDSASTLAPERVSRL